jgi:hypothetical protein
MLDFALVSEWIHLICANGNIDNDMTASTYFTFFVLLDFLVIIERIEWRMMFIIDSSRLNVTLLSQFRQSSSNSGISSILPRSSDHNLRLLG